MPGHQHLDNRGLQVVLTAAGRGRARFIWRLLGVGATDTTASISGSGATGVGTLHLRPMAASIEWVGVIFSPLLRPFRAGVFVTLGPRALPWATQGRPVGAEQGQVGGSHGVPFRRWPVRFVEAMARAFR